MSDEAFDIAAGGMAAQRTAMDTIARQIAGTNAFPSTALPAGSEFIPASFSGALDDALAVGGPDDVGSTIGEDDFAAQDVDDEPAIVRSDAWQAMSPAVDLAPASDPIGAMVSLISAGRAYDANVASLQAAKQMDIEASDIDKY